MLNRAQYLKELGIDVWVERGNEPPLDSDPGLNSELALDWEPLAARVSQCISCDLHTSRTQTVFGVGDRQAKLLIIGEAPGAEEDKQGEPFVGRAGQLLNSMLRALGFERNEVFIANILKCRPPNNRDPKPAEVLACSSFLERQIELLSPQVILAVGRIAAQNLLKVETPIGKMRGKSYTFTGARGEQNIPVVVTYHPAYLLRSPQEKGKVWLDLLAVKNMLEQIP